MSYNFPLSSVLWLREVVEEREERLLKNIQQEITSTVDQLSSLATEFAGADADWLGTMSNSCRGIHLHARYEQLEALRQRRKELEQRLEKLEELRGKQLAAYQLARRDREMLDGLHDQGLAAYATDMAKREQSTLDDTFGAQHARR